MNKVAEVQRSEICNATPALHAFTECDSTSAFTFVKKGNTAPLKLLKSHSGARAFLDKEKDKDAFFGLKEVVSHLMITQTKDKLFHQLK